MPESVLLAMMLNCLLYSYHYFHNSKKWPGIGCYSVTRFCEASLTSWWWSLAFSPVETSLSLPRRPPPGTSIPGVKWVKPTMLAALGRPIPHHCRSSSSPGGAVGLGC